MADKENDLKIRKEVARLLQEMQTLKPGSEEYKAVAAEAKNLNEMAVKNAELSIKEKEEIDGYKAKLADVGVKALVQVFYGGLDWLMQERGLKFEEKGFFETSKWKQRLFKGPRIK